MSGGVDATVTAALSGYSRRAAYLVGVSGGADSIGLLHLLDAAGFNRLTVCHFTHGLRPESAAYEKALVARAAKRLACGFVHATGDTRSRAREKGISLETAARQLRLAFFEQCSKELRCRRVFLAHHADDQIETVLLNLFRGTGLAGLAGMSSESQYRRLTLLRPLLGIRQAALRRYVVARGLRFAEDPGNKDLHHSRNRIRHEVLPAIRQAMGASSEPAILRMAEILRSENEWLNSLVGEPSLELNARELRSQPHALQRRSVLAWLRSQGVPEPGFEETERVLGLLAGSEAPAKVNLPGNHHARRRSGRIFLEAAKPTGRELLSKRLPDL